MSGNPIWRLQVEPGDALVSTELPIGYLVVAETERKAWAAVQKYVRDQEGPVTINETEAWKKGSRRAECLHIGYANDNVEDGILVADYGA